jgi:GcrA cell cycle regulator
VAFQAPKPTWPASWCAALAGLPPKRRACLAHSAPARQVGASGVQHSSHRKAINMSANCATWTSERIEQLKRRLHAGLSCRQIAREIGVTRNAVIGKMSRLGLSQPKDVIDRQLEQRRAARLARAKTPRPKHPRLNIFAQHEMLMAPFPRPQPPAEDIPIYNGRGCTLLELSQGKCRWPISNPGAEDFCFCGNEPVKGLPYCLGHARIAYRSVGRQRSNARA